MTTSAEPTSRSDITAPAQAPTSTPALVPDASTDLPRNRIGEELPVFCERCGYSLNGLPMSRCANCTILQFHCPECGHHQPINTLRPAFQTLLGRARAAFLAMVILFKLGALFWGLFAWVAMGAEWSYGRDIDATGWRNYVPAIISLEMIVAFMLYGIAFGAIARMMLLRWRRGGLVGTVLAVLMIGATLLGIWIIQIDVRAAQSLYTREFLGVILIGATCVVLGASIVWGIWSMLVHVFLPRNLAAALLDWQRFRPARRASALARE